MGARAGCCMLVLLSGLESKKRKVKLSLQSATASEWNNENSLPQTSRRSLLLLAADVLMIACAHQTEKDIN